LEQVQAARNIWEAEEDFVASLCKRLVAQISMADKSEDPATIAAADRSVTMVATGATHLHTLHRAPRMGHKIRVAEHSKLCQRLRIWLRKHVARMAAAPLAGVVRLLVDVGRMDDEMLDAVARRLHRNRAFCTDRHRAMLLATFARGGYQPRSQYVTRLCRHVLERGKSGLDASFVLWALAQYAPDVPQNVPELLARKVASDSRCHELKTLVSATWALSVLKCITTPDGQAVAELLLHALAQEQALGASKIPGNILREVMHAHIIAEHCGGGLDLPESLTEVATGAWLQVPRGVNATVAVRLERLLVALEVPHEMEVAACDGLIFIPVVVDCGEEV
jgi:hypothetical protein